MSEATTEKALRVPPNSIEAETAVLSALVQTNSLIFDLDTLLRTEYFYRREHQVIYRAISKMAMQSKPVDSISLVEQLNDTGDLDNAGGVENVIEIVNNFSSADNARHYAEIIRSRYLDRRIIQAGMEIANAGFEKLPTQEKIDLAQKLTMALSIEDTSEATHINQAIKNTVAELERRGEANGRLLGLATGLTDLDKMTGGLEAGDLIVIAGRPSMGKTALAGNIAENAVLDGKFVIFYSLEMPHTQIVMRTLASVGKIPFNQVKAGKFDNEASSKLMSVGAKLKDREYYIDDSPSLTSAQVLSKSRKIAQRAGRKPDLIVIDYLQLMTDKGPDGETQRITDISRNIKLAARELGCPIILLSQLNRELEKRHDKRPLMSDLRSSGAIEQDADIVLMMYRDEVYNEDSQHKGVAEAIIRKQRNGETGTVYLAALLHQMRFEDLQHGYRPYAERKPKGYQHMDQFDD